MRLRGEVRRGSGQGVDGGFDFGGESRGGVVGVGKGLPGDGFAEDYTEFFVARFAELAGKKSLLDVDFQTEFLATARCCVEARGVLSDEVNGDYVAFVFDGFGDK